MSVVKSVLWMLLIVVAALVLFEAIRLLMLKRDITTYKQFWDKQNVQSATAESGLYIALGDSTAQGLGASTPKKGYVGLLAKEIAETSGSTVHVVNLSVTGAKIKDVIKDQLPRLQQMQLPSETIVTIEIGANDLSNFDPDAFYNQMEMLLRQLPPQTVVADMPYFGGGRVRNQESAAFKASEIINSLAAANKLRVAPLHQITKQHDNLWVYAADFFHPNDRGYLNWYKAFHEALNQ